MTGPVDHRPLRGDAAVVEHRLAHELDLDPALEALDVRTSVWSASSSAGGRVCGVIASSRSQGPIVRASWTTIHPVGVRQVVESTFVPGA